MVQPVVLSLQDVTIRYGARVAVAALSLEVQRGEVFGLLGPNGCGKSSTLSAIVGALAPAAGSIVVAGRRHADDPLAYRRHIGLVPQELALFEELSAEDNLLFFGRLYGLKGPVLRQRVAEALQFVRLEEQAHLRARTLSGGMQRRLNLGCALLHNPGLLLLDEPTVGLDVQSRDAIFASLRALRDQGRALVFTTHHLEEAEQLCDRVGIMDRGRLLAVGTLDELCTNSTGPRLEGVFRELTGRSAA
jgi:ABC-2 type transport system ATP-binding protein